MHNYVRIYIRTHHIASFSQSILLDTYAPEPIASASCDTTLFLCKKLTFQIKIYTQTQISCFIF